MEDPGALRPHSRSRRPGRGVAGAHGAGSARRCHSRSRRPLPGPCSRLPRVSNSWVSTVIRRPSPRRGDGWSRTAIGSPSSTAVSTGLPEILAERDCPRTGRDSRGSRLFVPPARLPRRGFSFSADGPLDMRMGSDGVTAAELVNTADEEDLVSLFWRYGEERRSRAVARAIVRQRPLGSTS